jgi:signal transduction histidine kinase
MSRSASRDLVRIPLLRDLALVAVLGIGSVPLVVSALDNPKLWFFFRVFYGADVGGRLAAWCVASGVALAAVVARRRWPVPALAAAAAAAAAHFGLAVVNPAPVDASALVCLFSVADLTRRRVSVLTAAACMVAAVLIVSFLVPATPFFMAGQHRLFLSVDVLALALAWFAGDNARTRRAYLAQTEQRAAAAERSRDQQGQIAAAAERERIARELHDVIAHGLSIMIIQAQGGDAALDVDPGKARAALHSILDMGRESLAEVRRLLGVERSVRQQPDLSPQPGLEQLPDCLGQFRGAGLPVTLSVRGDPGPLPPGVSLSAFRIIQEALTNTLKHATGPTVSARVEVTCAAGHLDIEVTDTGADPAGRPGSGQGLLGMGERVKLLGGSLAAGPTPAGGFRVRARLPLTADLPVG